MKRSPIKRRSGLRTYTPIRKTGGLPRKNAARRKSEFARCYHSKERVEFVKSLGCAAQGMSGGCAGPIENAHTRTDGMGRKSDYAKIAPLCAQHHIEYDERLGVLAFPWARGLIVTAAADTEKLWSDWQAREIE